MEGDIVFCQHLVGMIAKPAEILLICLRLIIRQNLGNFFIPSGHSGMGMSTDNHINLRNCQGQLLVLGLLQIIPDAAMGKADNDIHILSLQLLHYLFCRLHGVLKGKAGERGAVGRVHAHQTENSRFHAAPLDNGIVLCSIGIHGILN